MIHFRYNCRYIADCASQKAERAPPWHAKQTICCWRCAYTAAPKYASKLRAVNRSTDPTDGDEPSWSAIAKKLYILFRPCLLCLVRCLGDITLGVSILGGGGVATKIEQPNERERTKTHTHPECHTIGKPCQAQKGRVGAFAVIISLPIVRQIHAVRVKKCRASTLKVVVC